MDTQLEQLLADKHPIFDRSRSPDTPFNYLGFECGPGWGPLLDEFATKAETLDLETLVICQAKEKFWHLIIYFDATGKDEDAMEDLAIDIEAKSTLICDGCGELKPHHSGCHERARHPDIMRQWAVEQLSKTR